MNGSTEQTVGGPTLQETTPIKVKATEKGTAVSFTNTSVLQPSTGVSSIDMTSMAGLLAVAAVGGAALFAASRRKHGQDAWKE